MAVIIILLTVSMLVAGGFLAAFASSMRQGQFDDTVSPAVRMLIDDEDKNALAISDKAKKENKEHAQKVNA
ncbi:cytochrome oxidase maturation protein, cbb3-type [Flexibacter flexilis DSM 6793]|uniref:Cytochrome oxidase maturation protein, cbb3-type n=1 Tax=Flexibacter flexilis DSM 6793 TaxID=927664 RepID=A0A1I1LF63_9BACT|nr:cbb3-type cytochrome oxidase assembly protein CcoS [Flexibacter flexilis]SFC68130.1 cytochrome oxidase maturation protein, cbb3-type [Flexibacter flexilis DSM 6793]